jgi:flagellar biosynthesis protein FlhA
MPGKQMSIDADLNAGLINEAEARRRRLTIAQEADFYGAMDGASKFVRGDAIAAIIIILVNILGGLTIGALQQGMSVANALQTYTLLTVGEGLVTQVPALIISTAAGMVVTRAASEADLGEEIAKQVFVSPKALGTASAILIGLGLVPGLPHVAFLVLGSLMGWLAYEQAKHQQAELAAPAAAEALAAKPVEAQPHVTPLDLMEVQVGYGLINLVDGEQGGTLLDRIKALRKTTAQSMGFLIPPIHIRDNLQLRPNEYSLLLKGVELVRSEVLPGHVLAIDPGTAQKNVVQGIPTKEPAFGLPALWVPEGNREQAQMAGYTVVDASSAITTHLSEVIKRHAHELLGRQEVQSLLDELAKTHPKVVEELMPNLLSLGAVVRILANLLRERVAVRDLRTILEAVADHAGVTKDPEILTEAARQALARSITRQHMNPDGLVPVIALDPRLDRKLAELSASGNQSGEWALEPAMSQKLMGALKQAGERMVGKGQQPVILCSPGVRRHLRRLLDRIMPTVPVLSYAEIDGMAKVKAVETVRAMEEAA